MTRFSSCRCAMNVAMTRELRAYIEARARRRGISLSKCTEELLLIARATEDPDRGLLRAHSLGQPEGSAGPGRGSSRDGDGR